MSMMREKGEREGVKRTGHVRLNGGDDCCVFLGILLLPENAWLQNFEIEEMI